MATTAPSIQPSATLAASTLGIAKRGLLKFLRTPQLVVLGTIQGALFLLIFRYVFGGAIGAGGLSYVDFLVPGFITTGILFSGMGAAAGMAEDLEQGFVDRLWPTPPWWCGAWRSPPSSGSPSASACTAA
jgi:ABC-2 type transport system permease protein